MKDKDPKFEHTDRLFKAAEAAAALPDPMDVLQAMYKDAPDGIRAFLNGQAREILMLELPKLKLVIEQGPVVPVDALKPLVDIFAEALATADKVAPTLGKRISATTRDAGTLIAEQIDTAFRRTLLTDKVADHMAYVDAMSCHARLVKCIEDIALSPEQAALYEKTDDVVSH